MNKILGLLLSASLLLTGCEQKVPEREQSPVFDGVAQVYFPTSAIFKEFDPKDQVTSYSIEVSRKDSIGALTVPLVVEAADSLFSIPSTVNFKDGEKTTSFTVSFANAVEGVTYAALIAIDQKMVNPYASTISKCDFSFVNLAWTDADFPSVWEDLSWTGAFGMDLAIWYVKYQYASLPDGSKKFRFLNPYSSCPSNWDPETESGTPDKYGVYDGFPANYPTDFDPEGTFNGVVSVTASGKASWTRFDTGIDWGYGEMWIGNLCIDYSDCSEDDYPLGTLADSVISFPDQSMYLYIDGEGGYPGGKCIIYLDGKKYQEDHSVKHIADFEDGFNDQTEMQWTDISEGTQLFISEAFGMSWNQPIWNAIDIDPASGEKSEFLNLYCFPDLYEEGYVLAFYYDSVSGEITIPEKQPTGQYAANKQIMAGPGSNDCGVESLVVSGTPIQKITLSIALTTENGNLIDEYVEEYYKGAVVEWTIDAFVGNYTLYASSAFGYDPLVGEDTVSIYKGNDSTLYISGLPFCSDVEAPYNAEYYTMNVFPQVLDSVGEYDLSLITFDEDDNTSTYMPMEFSMNLDGSISLDANTEEIGYLLESEVGGGYMDGWYYLTFLPVAEEEAIQVAKPAKKNLSAHELVSSIKRTHGKHISTANMRIQPKASRYYRKSSTPIL